MKSKQIIKTDKYEWLANYFRYDGIEFVVIFETSDNHYLLGMILCLETKTSFSSYQQNYDSWIYVCVEITKEDADCIIDKDISSFFYNCNDKYYIVLYNGDNHESIICDYLIFDKKNFLPDLGIKINEECLD